MPLYFVVDRNRWGRLHAIVRADSPASALRETVLGWQKQLGIVGDPQKLELRHVVGEGARWEYNDSVPEGCDAYCLYEDGEPVHTFVLALKDEGDRAVLWSEDDSPDSRR